MLEKSIVGKNENELWEMAKYCLSTLPWEKRREAGEYMIYMLLSNVNTSGVYGGIQRDEHERQSACGVGLAKGVYMCGWVEKIRGIIGLHIN